MPPVVSDAKDKYDVSENSEKLKSVLSNDSEEVCDRHVLLANKHTMSRENNFMFGVVF